MWEEKKVAHETTRCHTVTVCVSITEQTKAKSYLFVLHNKKETP
jgi:hypothetical protein